MAYHEVAMKVRQKNRAHFISYHEVAMNVRQKNSGEFTLWPTMMWP
jgi:hypothetical protein